MKQMYFKRTPEGYFICQHCGLFLDDHPSDLDSLVHPIDEESGFLGKLTPAKCEFVGRIVKNPDVYAG